MTKDSLTTAERETKEEKQQREEEERQTNLRILRTSIFALVVPHKEPCSTHKIRMEYKEMEGEEIPFADYGHKTLDDFLLQHPQLNGMKQDGKWIFTAKPSELSANIQALVKGQKSKRRRKEEGRKEAQEGTNPFTRNFNRSSYHGKPTLGQGDTRRKSGTQPFNRNTQTYRSFTPGAFRPPIPASSNNARGSQQSGSSRPGSSVGWSQSTAHPPPFPRPSQPWGGNQTRKFAPTLRSSFNGKTSFSSVREDSPQEGMRRFNTILFKCKGSVTLRVFCRLYAQEFQVAFDGEELKRHFDTANLTDIIDKYGNDKILVSPTPDGSWMFSDSQVIDTHTHAARDLEEKKKNTLVVEPEKKHCCMPSLAVMFDALTEMLVHSFPNGIHPGEISVRYQAKTGVWVDPVTVFALQWNELIEKKFNSRVRIDNEQAFLTPTYIMANNLQVKTIGERKKQEVVTLADLGIVYVEDSNQEDEDEKEEDSQRDTAYLFSLIGVNVKNPKTSWRAPTSGYESMCSSVSSSVQTLNASPDKMDETIISEEMDDLAERMGKEWKVEMDQSTPRREQTTQSSPSTLKRNLVTTSSGIEENAVVKKEEKEVKEKSKFARSLFSKLGFNFKN